MSQEEVLKIILVLVDAMESAAVSIKRQIAKMQEVEEEPSAIISEGTFSMLDFESQKGTKIGDFEVAYKSQNLPDKWNHAYNILRQANATIGSRYHCEGYQHAYWLYGAGKIYRQLLRQSHQPKEEAILSEYRE